MAKTHLKENPKIRHNVFDLAVFVSVNLQFILKTELQYYYKIDEKHFPFLKK